METLEAKRTVTKKKGEKRREEKRRSEKKQAHLEKDKKTQAHFFSLIYIDIKAYLMDEGDLVEPGSVPICWCFCGCGVRVDFFPSKMCGLFSCRIH